MAENSKNTKLLSYVLLLAGIAGLGIALVLDFTGSQASYRGALLVIGAVVFFRGDGFDSVRFGYYLFVY